MGAFVNQECGSGGTGEVYKAEDTRLKRTVALNGRTGGPSPNGSKRPRASSARPRCSRASDHPNIVTIHDCIETTTSVTLVLEYVHGTRSGTSTSAARCRSTSFLEYFQQLVSAVGAVHEAGLIHRDINPKNILVSAAGAIKLMDFGLAADASDPQPRAGGTLGYMAPEALRKGVRPGFGRRHLLAGVSQLPGADRRPRVPAPLRHEEPRRVGALGPLARETKDAARARESRVFGALDDHRADGRERSHPAVLENLRSSP
jgi:serine/threonine protein kinase